MQLTICGSLKFITEMNALKNTLESMGHKVELPPSTVPGPDGSPIPTSQMYEIYKEAKANDVWVWCNRENAIRNHYAKIESSDAIVVANYDKNGVPGYVGVNTMMEMGLAFYLRRPIYLLNPIPELAYVEEIRGMKPIVLNGDLSKLT